MSHAVSKFIVDNFYWLLLAILALNEMQRRYRAEVAKKRLATLYLAIMVFVLYMYAYGLIRLNLTDLLLLAYLALAAALIDVFRKTFLPFKLRCTDCGKSLSFNNVMFSDSNRCDSCAQRK